MKILILLSAFILFVTGCAAPLSIDRIKAFTPESKILLLTNNSRYDAKIRTALAKNGFKVLKWSSQQQVVSKGQDGELARIYNEATARYGLTFYWEFVARCAYNSTKQIDGTFEITDINTNEVLLVIENGGMTGACGQAGGTVFDGLAEALLQNWGNYEVGEEVGTEPAKVPLGKHADGVETDDFHKAKEAEKKGDHATAFKLLRPLAEQGDAIAQVTLATMYREGKGVLQDFKESVKWYRKAAEQGHAVAQKDFGVMYAKSYGIAKNLVRAHMWYNLSANNGNEGGSINRDLLAKEMTPAQIAEAQDMAKECLKKNYKNCD